MFYAPIILIPHLHNVYDSSQAPQSHVLTDQVRPDQGGHGEVPHKSAQGGSQAHRAPGTGPQMAAALRRHN
jgi:hypothetical protein